MQNSAARVVTLAWCLFAAGCASRPLPKYEKPLARAQFQTVRTTAYTHTESDHRKYGKRSASGGMLRSGALNSAACDWSRWPVGTMFRIQETGETFVVDDYGWALAGRNTIDLYQPTRAAMDRWGVRRVDIEILQWGDAARSLAILSPRTRHAHVRRMVDDLRRRYADHTQPGSPDSSPVHAVTAADASPPDAQPIASRAPIPEPAMVADTGVNRSSPGGFTPVRPNLTPFVETR